MSKSGKTTFAQKLAHRYGLKVFEFGEYMSQKLQEYIAKDAHVACNPLGHNISFNKSDFDKIQKGEAFDKKLLLPMLLHDNGIELYEKPPPPKEEGSDEELDEEERKQREEEARKKEEE